MNDVIYEGTIDQDGHHVDVIADGKRQRLKPRNDLVNHSPDGFCWGYSGSGPAQLALGLLAYHLKRYPEDVAVAWLIVGSPDGESLSDGLAILLHQRFKLAWVAERDQKKGFRVTDGDVRCILREMAGLEQAPQQGLPGVVP